MDTKPQALYQSQVLSRNNVIATLTKANMYKANSVYITTKKEKYEAIVPGFGNK